MILRNKRNCRELLTRIAKGKSTLGTLRVTGKPVQRSRRREKKSISNILNFIIGSDARYLYQPTLWYLSQNEE